MVQPLKTVLMQRDDLTEEEARDAIAEARADLHERLAAGEMPHDICEEYFGLEPDYLMDLL